MFLFLFVVLLVFSAKSATSIDLIQQAIANQIIDELNCTSCERFSSTSNPCTTAIRRPRFSFAVRTRLWKFTFATQTKRFLMSTLVDVYRRRWCCSIRVWEMLESCQNMARQFARFWAKCRHRTVICRCWNRWIWYFKCFDFHYSVVFTLCFCSVWKSTWRSTRFSHWFDELGQSGIGCESLWALSKHYRAEQSSRTELFF